MTEFEQTPDSATIDVLLFMCNAATGGRRKESTGIDEIDPDLN